MKNLKKVVLAILVFVGITSANAADDTLDISSYGSDVEVMKILLGMSSDFEINQALANGNKWTSSETQRSRVKGVKRQFKEWGLTTRTEYSLSIDQISGLAGLVAIKTLYPEADERQLRSLLRMIRNRAQKEITAVEAVASATKQLGVANSDQIISDAIQSAASEALIWAWICPETDCSNMDDFFRHVPRPNTATNQYWANQKNVRANFKAAIKEQSSIAAAQAAEAKRTATAAKHRFGVASQTSGAVRDENLRKARSAVRRAENAAAKAAAAKSAMKALREKRDQQVVRMENQIQKLDVWNRWLTTNIRKGGGESGIRTRSINLDKDSTNDRQRDLNNSASQSIILDTSPIFKLSVANLQRNGGAESAADSAFETAANATENLGPSAITSGGAVVSIGTGALTGGVPGAIGAGATVLAGVIDSEAEKQAGWALATNSYMASNGSNTKFSNPSASDRSSLGPLGERLDAVDRETNRQARNAISAARADAKKNGTSINHKELMSKLEDIHNTGRLAKNRISAAMEIDPLEKWAIEEWDETNLEAEKARREADAAREAERAADAATEEQNKETSSDDGFPNSDGSDSGTGGNGNTNDGGESGDSGDQDSSDSGSTGGNPHR